MVLNDIAQRADRVVELAPPTFHANRFRDGDLHVIDVFLAEQRLEYGIAKPYGQDVLYRLLPEVMVDAEDLAFVQDRSIWAFSSRADFEVEPEGFFHHNARPDRAARWTNAPRVPQVFDDGREILRRGGQIVQAVARSTEVLLDSVETLVQATVILRMIEAHLLVVNVGNEGVAAIAVAMAGA